MFKKIKILAAVTELRADNTIGSIVYIETIMNHTMQIRKIYLRTQTL